MRASHTDDGSAPPHRVVDFAEVVRREVEGVVLGKAAAVHRLTVAFLCQGHVLLEDVPGTGKTVLARAFAATLGRPMHRVQCTPDLLPSEVTGVNVYDQGTSTFRFRPGPVFTNVLLVDEVNRATPRTQSALLEAMAERQVSVDGTTHALPTPFMVLATQNPVDHAGTFPLPEAQLDRFLLRVELGYPDHVDEVQVLHATRSSHPLEHVTPAAAGFRLEALWEEIAGVHTDATLLDWVVDIVTGTRTHPAVQLGASVRGSMALHRAARAAAAVAGRDYVVPDDVVDLAEAVLAHRLHLRAEHQVRGTSAGQVVSEVLDRLDVPVAERRG